MADANKEVAPAIDAGADRVPTRDERLLPIDEGTEVYTGSYKMEEWPFGDSQSTCVVAASSMLQQIADLRGQITLTMEQLAKWKRWYAEWVQGHHQYQFRSANEILRENKIIAGYNSYVADSAIGVRCEDALARLAKLEEQLLALHCPDDEGSLSGLSGQFDDALMQYTPAKDAMDGFMITWEQFKKDHNCPEAIDPYFD